MNKSDIMINTIGGLVIGGIAYYTIIIPLYEIFVNIPKSLGHR